jgi:hypothetical protein
MPDTNGLTWAAVNNPEPYLDGQTPMAFFDQHITLIGDFGCWVWTGRIDLGYGKISASGHSHMAHRFSYVVHRDLIPDGLTLDHLCRVKACVNPWHLEPVTQGVNSLRTWGYGGTLRSRLKGRRTRRAVG